MRRERFLTPEHYAKHVPSPSIGTEPAEIRGLKSEVVPTNQGIHGVESCVQLSNRRWTTPRNKRHADAWQEKIHRTRSICRPAVGVWPDIPLSSTFGKVLAAVGRVCGPLSVVGIEARCDQNSTDLVLLSPFVYE